MNLPPGFELDQAAPSAQSAPALPQGFELDAPGVAADVVKSAAIGVPKAAIGLAGLPGNMVELGQQGLIWALRKAGVSEDTLQKAQQFNDEFRKKGMVPQLPTSDKIQKGVEQYTGEFYKPKTVPGEYAQTMSEFGATALAGPGGPVGNVIKYGLLPGAAAETAKQATKGTGFEAPASIGAALVTGGVAGALSRPGTAAQAIRAQLPEGVTPQMVTQAEGLMNQAVQQGVTLTWPEALSQVAGRPVLSNLARHLEAAPATEGRMAEFYGQRPQQVETAGRNAMGGIAPPNYAPSTIGPQAGQAAEETVHGVRQAINRTAEPYYRASEGVLLNPQEMARVRALPGYPEAAAAVRNDPQLNRYVAHLPENSVGFLNEVKKQLDYQGRNAAAPMGPQGIPNQQRVAGFTSDAAAARQIGVDASRRTNPAQSNYETALNIEEHGRRQFLDPLLQGPIGKLAGRDTTTKNAIDALFPSNPLPNSEHEIAAAVGALAQRSPRVAGDLVRAHVESVFNEATQALQSGANQAGGAKFAAILVGNPQQRANFEAAVRALPNGDARLEGFNRFLEVMQATGTRQNIGSKTAYNQEFLKEASSSGIAGEVAKGAANPVSRFTAGLVEKYERWRLGRNLNELADILTNPAAVGQLRAISRMPVGSPQAQAAAWRIAQLTRSATLSDQSGQAQQPRQ